MANLTIETERLLLVAGTGAIERAAASGRDALTRELEASVPKDWPPPLSEDVQGYWAGRLDADPAYQGWTAWYWLDVQDARAPTLVGYGGFKGPPNARGIVEVGYGVVVSRQRRGYATEATHGLIAWAFEDPRVKRVIAHTLPGLAPSIGVLGKLGFRFTGPSEPDSGEEPGAIRYELPRL